MPIRLRLRSSCPHKKLRWLPRFQRTLPLRPLPNRRSSMKLSALVVAASLFAAPAFAADLATKAPSLFAGPYPSAKCGMYYGVGTGGSAGAVDGAVVGTQIVQGELDALIGYTCPFATNAFWF